MARIAMATRPGPPLSRLVAAFAALASIAAAPASAEARTISFSGYDWLVKSASLMGPGPNAFSDSTENVWVDAQGRLHLKITQRKGKWSCAEVINTTSLGHGEYRFYVASEVANLDRNAVLGLFTWDSDPAHHNREIDIEFSRWGAGGGTNAGYTVQPYTDPENGHHFDWPVGVGRSTHLFRWLSGSARFQSVIDWSIPPVHPTYVLEDWERAGSVVPPAGGEAARINLWLFQGKAPSSKRSTLEVVIDAFEFVPAE
jgi:hypothetical protein